MNKKIFSTAVVFIMALVFFASCGARRNISTATTDEGVVINGIRWATRNVDAPGTFAPYPESSGMFFQWNRKKGWSATDEVTDWNSSIPTGTEWYAENDPCPPGWRVPTETELRSLNRAGSTWTSDWHDTGVNGRIFGTYPYQIFLPAIGFRNASTGEHLNRTRGFYWSSTQVSTSAWHSDFGSGSSSMFHYARHNGFPIRCVAK